MSAAHNHQRQEAIEAMRNDPAVFRASLRIDASGKAVHLRDVVQPWQERDFRALDETWRRVVGLEPRGKVYAESWLGRGRGCSKSTDIAITGLWVALAAKTAFSGVIIAASKDQSRIIIRQMRKLMQLNTHLRTWLEVQNDVLRNREYGGEWMILPAEENLVMGQIPDAVVADELVHWNAAGERTWSAIYSASAKRENCHLCVISNSGVLDSWQHRVFQSIVDSPDAYHSQTDATETLSSERKLAAQRRMLTPLEFSRLFENRWVPDSASGLDEQALKACVCRYPYPMDPTALINRGLVYIAGADLSATKDASAISVWSINGQTGKIRLAWSKEFLPKRGEVDLINVASTIRMVHEKYHPVSWRMDNFESRRLSQEMRRMGIQVVIESFQGNAAAVQASALLDAVNTAQLELHESETMLLAQFRSLSLQERNGVLRIVADRTARGHCDQAFSCIVALPAAQELASRRTYFGESITTGHASNRTPGRFGVHLSTNRFSPRNGVFLDTQHGAGWVRR